MIVPPIMALAAVPLNSSTGPVLDSLLPKMHGPVAVKLCDAFQSDGFTPVKPGKSLLGSVKGCVIFGIATTDPSQSIAA